MLMLTVNVFVDSEWWFHWLIQQSELNWPLHRIFSLSPCWCEQTQENWNRLKKLWAFSAVVVVVVAFHFRLLSWRTTESIFSWLLASMIKWFQLRAVKVVVHLIDLPSSFTITHRKSKKLLNRFGSQCGFFKYTHSSLIVIKWTSLITSFRTNSKLLFLFSCVCDNDWVRVKIIKFGIHQRVSRKMHTFPSV